MLLELVVLILSLVATSLIVAVFEDKEIITPVKSILKRTTLKTIYGVVFFLSFNWVILLVTPSVTEEIGDISTMAWLVNVIGFMTIFLAIVYAGKLYRKIKVEIIKSILKKYGDTK